MSEIIQFQPLADDGAPKVQRARGKRWDDPQKTCPHPRMTVDDDTQLVTCKQCGLVMSAYSALMVIVKQWERMHYDTTEWKKMRTEQGKSGKAEKVRRIRRELQWIECPDEGDEPARTYWVRLKELGAEPYAMFHRGRHSGGQYCIIRHPDAHRGYVDAESYIRSLENERANAVCLKRESAASI